MAPKVHLICSILPKESKFCITLKHSFRAGIWVVLRCLLSKAGSSPRDDVGSLWPCSSVLPSHGYQRAGLPRAVRPLGQHLGSHLWLELEPPSFAHAWGWWWGDGVVVSPPWPGSQHSLHTVQQRDIVPQPAVSSPPSQLWSCNQPLHPNTPNGSNFLVCCSVCVNCFFPGWAVFAVTGKKVLLVIF